jgi:hypothetical protein
MHGDDGAGTLFDAQFIGIPVAGTYEITLTPPSNSTSVQLNVTFPDLKQYTAKPITGGVHTATVTVDNGQPHLTFTDASFVKAAVTKIISGDITCQ